MFVNGISLVDLRVGSKNGNKIPVRRLIQARSDGGLKWKGRTNIIFWINL
jgi:hypothetical protein